MLAVDFMRHSTWLPACTYLAGSVVGLGGLSGAVGGMLMAKFAGVILETVGSFGPIFAVASVAYLIALAVIHVLLPRYQPVVASVPGNPA